MSLAYDYYPAVLFAINALSQGVTLSEACDEANITVTTFKSYVERDVLIAQMFAEAEQRSYDAMADALINIDNHRVHGQSNPQMAKVISDNIKWVLARRRPKEYGEKIEIKHEIAMDVTITTALNRARQRSAIAAPEEDLSMIEEAVVVEDEDAMLRALLS